ncbi:MAG: hypothetical protein JXR12_01150 [Neptunomonas phycophila]|uniref:hypothetical protein n=1 Tax=Neptunomonas phycophila TaxID=1572645 RepID=UPI003B8E3852
MDLRCYHFGNMYLSSIQQGIQAAHSEMELFNKYDSAQAEHLNQLKHVNKELTEDERLYIQCTKTLYDWSKNHKTMICLNGGYLSNMLEIVEHLKHDDNPFPWSTFHESEEALGGILTNIAIVLPDYIYDTASWLRGYRNQLVTFDGDPNFYYPEDAGSDYQDQAFTWWEGEFMNMLNKCGLAK